jgi:acylphosphatase
MNGEETTAAVSMRFLVSGRVQRVRFRAATRRRALELRLGGWARNLDDGRVEVLACGEAGAVSMLAQWLRHGPRLARVDDVQEHVAEAVTREGFHIL